MTAPDLAALVRAAASRRPDALAVRAPDGELSYAELDALSQRMAHALARVGVGPRDRVAVWLPKSMAAVAAMQAVLRLRAAYVPIDPASPRVWAELVMRDCGVAATVLRRAGIGVTIESVDGSAAIALTELAADAQPAESGPPSPDELAYILYTSGSTGRPKGVCISHANALAFVQWLAAELELTSEDRLANHAPLHFDLSVFDLYGAFGAGASVALVPQATAYSPSGLVDFVREERVTVWYSVPAALILMLERGGLRQGQLPDLRAVLFAGEPFPAKHLRRLRDALPDVRLLNLYGPTETNVCTFHEVRELSSQDRRPVPIGRACSGDRVRALRQDGTEAAIGEDGELVVEGPTVMLGYWGQPPQGDRPYHTGDIVTRIGEHEYDYVGRRDNMVKIRGHRIETGEIEACLLEHAGVASVAVVAEGEAIERELVAYVVAAGEPAPTLLELKRHCADRLPRYMIVDRVQAVPGLPRTSTGKVDRRTLLSRGKEPVV